MGWYEDVRVSQPSVSPARLGDGNVNIAALTQAESSLSDSKFNSIDRGIKQLQNLFTEPNIASRKRDDELFAMSERFGDTLNKQSEIARKNEERQASDLYYNELAKGVQEKGGLYGSAITKEANKYQLTPEEIDLSTQYKNDPLLARAAGQNALADKLAWQLNAGDKADSFVASNLGDESRTEMYDRINSLVAKQGLAIPKEGIVSADQARLAERTAEESKAKLLDDRRAEIEKNQTSNLWKVVNSKGNEQIGTDSEGNPIQISTGSKGSGAQNRFNNSFNNDLSKGSNDITEAIAKNTKGATDTSKSLTASDALKFYNKLVKEEGIDPSVAAAQIVNGISTQDPKWYQLLTDKEAKFTKDTISQLLPTLKETSDIEKRTDIANGTNTGISSKEQAANNLSIALGEKDKLDLAKINEDRAKLLLTPDERRIEKANQWLEREGILAKQKELISPENNVFSTGQGYSDNESIIKKIANNETGGVKGSAYSKIHDSGALGKYGFVPSTALEQMKQLGYKGTKEELLNQFISTPSVQDKIMNNYVNVNTKTLSSKGVPVTDWTIWTAHNLGAGNAIKLAKGNVDEDVIDAISKNLPKGVKPTVSNYQEMWFDKINLGDESKTYKDDVKDRLLNTKEDDASTIKKIDNGSTQNINSGSEQKDNSSTSDISDKYIKSVFEKEKEAAKDDFFGDGSVKANTNLIQSGVPQKDIDRVIQEKKDKERSDNLIADRNYRVALRNNGIYDGKTAEEWNNLRSTTNKIGDYGWAAPVAAALAPAAMTAASIPVIANTVNGAINSIKSIGEAKRMQQMLDEAITTTSKAKQNAEDLQKIEQLKEAHKYLLQMMRRGMYY